MEKIQLKYYKKVLHFKVPSLKFTVGSGLKLGLCPHLNFILLVIPISVNGLCATFSLLGTLMIS